MKKQSSIEFLLNLVVGEDSEGNDVKVKDVVSSSGVRQAKEMEEQFIIDAFMEGTELGEMYNNENRKFYIDAKKYYKTTYESKH